MRRGACSLSATTRYQQENAFATLLRQCRDIDSARSTHSDITRSGLDSTTFLGNLIVQMYGNCRCIEQAQWAFNRITHRNVYSWNILLAAYAQNGLSDSVVRFFLEMNLQGEVLPNDFTYATVLGSCSDAVLGIQIHETVVENGLASDVFVGTALISMYGRYRHLHPARRSFEEIHEKDLVAWNAMITAYAQNGHLHCAEAVQLFLQMNLEGVQPDSYTFLEVISACTTLENLELGRRIHYRILDENSQSIQNALVNLYGKCACISEAQQLFDRIVQKDAFSWTAMISAFTAQGQVQEAMKLFTRMSLEGLKPEIPTLAVILGACWSPLEVRCIHSCIIESGYQSDIVIGTALINAYSSVFMFNEARNAFMALPVKDTVSWNAFLSACLQAGHDISIPVCEMELEGVKHDMQTYTIRIEACSQQGDGAEGRKAHNRLLLTGYISDQILTCLINMYSRCGKLEDAKMAFEEIHDRSVVAWTAVIAANAQNRHSRVALELFHMMENEGVEPDIPAYVSVIAACWRPEHLKDFHARVSGATLSDSEKLVVGTALVTMYGGLGMVEDAEKVFESIPCKDSVAYNAMSSVYVENEMYEEAIEIYVSMSVQPGLCTIVNTINSCTYLGELTEGKQLHAELDEAYEVLYPVVVTALVNMYGRCGSLRDAKALFDSAQRHVVASWNSMVAAYAQHGHVERALEMFREMQVCGFLPDKFTYVSVLQACSHVGMVYDGLLAFSRMGIDHGLIPVIEHYVCVVDLFGRVGQLQHAEEIVKFLPYEPDAVVWNSLLGACKVQGDMSRAERAADFALKLEYAASYILLANLYAAAGKWEDVASVRKAMADRGIRKPTGRSFQCIG